MYVTANGVQLKLSGAPTNWMPGQSGSSVETGTSGNDVFYAQSGNSLAGGDGDDQYYIWQNNVTITEAPGGGTDTVYSYAYGPVTLAANVENLFLMGDGSTVGYGNALSNIIVAGPKGSFLDGGAGDDVLVGGAGLDTFNIKAGNGSDAIENFTHGVDLIRLDGYGVSSFANLSKLMTQVGDDVRIALPNGEALIIRDTSVSTLSAVDFSLANNGAAFSVPAVTVTAAAAAGAGEQLLSGGGGVAFASGWAVLNNSWNAGGLTYGSDYRMDTGYHAADLTQGTTFTWTFPTVATSVSAGATIRAYPELSFGSGPYGGGAHDPGDTTYAFPVQVGALSSLEAKYNVSYAGQKAGYDVAFDLWLTNKPNGDQSSISNEVMIWLHQGDFQAAGQRVGTFTDGDFSASIYSDPTTHLTSIVSNSDSTVGSVDIAKVLSALEGLGIVHSSEYLADVELGAEVASGTGSLTVHSLELDEATQQADGSTLIKTISGMGSTSHVVPAPEAAPVVATTSNIDNGVQTASLSTVGTGATTVSDTLVATTGDDLLFVTHAGQQVIDSGGGSDTVIALSDWTETAGQIIGTIELADASNPAARNLTANDLGTTLIGNAADNVLTGGAGNDVIIGNGGADTLVGGKGDDVYIVDNAAQQVIEHIGEGNDTVLAKASYTLGAGQSIENLQAFDQASTDAISLTGNDLGVHIVGNAGADILTGGAGNDVIVGNGGADTMIGGKGDDVYIVDNAAQQVIEHPGEGNDTVLAKASYTLGAGQSIESLQAFDQSSTAALTLTGNDLGQYIVGGAGNDTIVGGAGNDVIVGGKGVDTLTGGGGVNDFVFYDGDTGSTAATADHITDFGHDQGDKIDFSHMSGAQNFSFHDSGADHVAGSIWLVHDGADTLVNLDIDGDGKADYVIHVTSTSSAPLIPSDFVL